MALAFTPYFYSDEATGFSTGRLATCAGCHANAKATDYAFGAWKFTE